MAAIGSLNHNLSIAKCPAFVDGALTSANQLSVYIDSGLFVVAKDRCCATGAAGNCKGKNEGYENALHGISRAAIKGQGRRLT